MRLLPVIATVFIATNITAQNVGIGTTNPQNKLHVAGGIRVDGLAGSSTGVVINNSIGDLSSIPFSFNTAHVLRGNGTFGPANGTVPAGGLVASEIYNNSSLISAGYSLIGELPSVIRYVTINSTFPANTWEPTYVRGIAANQSPPVYAVPGGGQKQAVIWTGTLLYVWEFAAIYSYNPDTDVWQQYPIDPSMSPVNDPKMVWTGTEIILWNGVNVTGYKFDPITATATPISVVNAPSLRTGYSMIWDGTRVIVWGGSNGSPINTGAFYNPVTDTWTTMSVTAAPSARFWHTAVWSTTTNRMIVWGGSTSGASGEFNTGGIYDPATNVWTGTTSTTNAPAARNLHDAIWTGTEMIVVGGQTAGSPLNTGGKYNPATNTWVATSTTGSPAISRAALAWSGTQLYVSGGLNGGSGSSSLLRYDPALNTWTNVTTFTKGKFDHYCFYKSNMILVWGGMENTLSSTVRSNEGYRYFLTNTSSSATTFNSRTLYLYQKL